jgi:tetratricopeptide (TPR) repeat protein
VRANAGLDIKEYDKAIADFSQSIKIAPGRSAPYFGRAFAWFNKQDYDKAIADFTAAIFFKPGMGRAYSGRGLARSAKGEFDRAIADFNEALRLGGEATFVYIEREIASTATNEYGKTIAVFNEAIEPNHNSAPASNNPVDETSRRNDREKEVTDYIGAVWTDLWLYDALNGLAWVLATCPETSLRDGHKAAETATKACDLTAWKNADPIGTLAAAYAEVGDFDAAVKAQTKAIELLTDEKTKADFRTRLAVYQQKQPYRQATSK